MIHKAWRAIEILGDSLRFEQVPNTVGITDWMFVSPQNLYVEALNAWWDGIWRWDLWEVINLVEVMRIGPSLVKKADTSLSLFLSPSPHPTSRLLASLLPFLPSFFSLHMYWWKAMGACSVKMSLCKPGKELSPGTESASTLTFGFLALGTKKNTCLLFKPHSLWYFALAAQADRDPWWLIK